MRQPTCQHTCVRSSCHFQVLLIYLFISCSFPWISGGSSLSRETQISLALGTSSSSSRAGTLKDIQASQEI